MSENQILESGHEVVAAGAENIFDRAVLVSLELGKLGVTKKVASSAVEVDCDKDLLHVSKSILDSEKLKLISRFDADTRLYLKNRSIPSKFRSGTFLVALGLVVDLDEWLIERAARRLELVRSFLWDYSRLQDEAILKLGSLYNSKDYPRLSKVEAAFYMQWDYAELRAARSLETISSDLYRRTKERITAQWQSAIDEGKNLLRSEFAGMVSHLADVLTPNSDGSPKRIKAPEGRRNWLSDIQDFLENFSSRDLSGDDELGAVVGQLRSMLSGGSVTDLKSDEALRDKLHESIGALQEAISGMVVSGGRNIDMSEDDEPVSPVSSDEWNLV